MLNRVMWNLQTLFMIMIGFKESLICQNAIRLSSYKDSSKNKEYYFLNGLRICCHKSCTGHEMKLLLVNMFHDIIEP